MMRRLIPMMIGWAALLNALPLDAQYTLVLIDRPFIQADSVLVGPEFFEYRVSGSSRFRSMERDKLFSVRQADGSERVLYVPDSLEGNWYSVGEMRDYLLGQEDVRKSYGRRANRGAFIGVLLGAGASFSRLYGALAIAAYPALTGSMDPAFKERWGYRPEMKDNAFYREGYGTMAKRLSTRRAFWGVLSGYVAGTVVLAFVFR